MRLLADLHISPLTVGFLRSSGHDVLRVNEVLPATATDTTIVDVARSHDRAILTQDLDFTAIIALSRRSTPSLICLRLTSSKIDHVNRVLARALPRLERIVKEGAIVTVTDDSLRCRRLPLEGPQRVR